jgi:xanthine dehydrogenase accessory factor
MGHPSSAPEQHPELPRVRTAAAADALREALARLDAGHRVVIATVLKRKGSTPSTPGQKLALLAPGEAVGTVGGGAVEHEVLAAMRAALADPKSEPRIERYDLGPSLGMCCGGSVEVLIEPMSAALSVLVVGAGHVGGALAPLLAGLGFSVVICDAREGAIEARGLAARDSLEVMASEHDDPEVHDKLGEAARAAALVMTHDHQLDQTVIEWALSRGFAYVGGVGSRAKAARTRQRLEAKGFSAEDIQRVRMPIGVEIHARSPAEIAVAIAAELVSWRAKLLGRDGRGHATP